jgi:hypothetical protein
MQKDLSLEHNLGGITVFPFPKICRQLYLHPEFDFQNSYSERKWSICRILCTEIVSLRVYQSCINSGACRGRQHVGRYNLATFVLRNMGKGRDTHVLDKSTSRVKTLGARVKTRRMFLTEDPQILTLSDPTSDLVRQYDFPVVLRCRKTSDTVFVAFVRPLSEPVWHFSSCSTDFSQQIAQVVLFLFLHVFLF